MRLALRQQGNHGDVQMIRCSRTEAELSKWRDIIVPLITQWAQVNVIRLFFRSTLLIFILAISLSIMGDSAAHPVPGSDVELSHSYKLPPSYKTAISEDANESVINEQNSGAPYIVANGVSMHEVSHAEAGGWKVRAPGDDTYGKGELIVVSVEFSEPVQADSDMTFRIQMGSVNRGLVPVDARGNTVLFGAQIRPQDRDGNGIWIGDNTATLDHNDADSIRSRGSSPRNADWDPSEPGHAIGPQGRWQCDPSPPAECPNLIKAATRWVLRARRNGPDFRPIRSGRYHQRRCVRTSQRGRSPEHCVLRG